MIEKRKCGKSNIEISVVGVGCWSYGGGPDDYWGAQDQQAVNEVVHAALDAGINHFDTAEVYNEGRSEEALGVALKGRRERAVIASKIWPGNTEPTVLRRHCEDSLRRLGTDYLDIYYVHWPITDQSVPDAFATLMALKSEGKIRSVSVSNFGVQQLSEALDTGAQIDLNQLCYNLISRGLEVEILPLCRRHQVGIVAYMPLMQGLLAGKYANVAEIPPNRRRTRHFRGDVPPATHGGPGAEEETFACLDKLRELSAEHDIPMAHLAMAWVMARPGVTCTLVGARNLQQLQDTIAAAQLELPSGLMQQLDELSQPLLDKLGTSPDYWNTEANSWTR